MTKDNSMRILYMEDDLGLARLFQKRLEREGFSVDIAHNGEDGISLLEKALYEVIVVDYNMPVCNGLDVIRRLSSKITAPPIIMLTGAGNEKIAVEAMKLGAADYVVKDSDMGYIELFPIVIEQVLTKIQLINERKNMEVELLKAKKLESVGILAGGIAHDFNNLLTAIMGNISIAKMHLSSEDKIFELLDKAEKEAVRAADLTNQLITFSKGGIPFKKTTSIADLIKNIVHFSLSGTDIRAEFSLPGDLRPVDIDEGQIRQVIHNMISNAQDAMPQGGAITISGEDVSIGAQDGLPLKDGEYLKVSVKDTGMGISAENLHKIFDPYFTTKEMGSQKGMGLGLAICYSVIKNHEGFIGVESQAGIGTTFHIYLPVSHKQAAAVKEAVEKPLIGRGRVLLMDDEEIIRDVACEMLKRIGYKVELACDGAEAIMLYKKAVESGQPFDAVILDLTIAGGMGGKETISKLIEIDKDVKAIVSSGYSHDPVVSEYYQYGFKGVMSKPYKIRELSETVSKVIGASSEQ